MASTPGIVEVDAPAVGGFRSLSSSRVAELYRERPREDAHYLEFRAADGFAAFVHVDAVCAMARFGRDAPGLEVIGRLGGRRCRDGTGGYVLVERATPDREARGGAGHVVSDLSAQKRLREDFDRECRALDPVGWWHTHLSHVGLFYSGVDRENQASWSNPDSIGIVLHPGLEGEALKVFRGPKSVELKPISDPEAVRSAVGKRSPKAEHPRLPAPGLPRDSTAREVVHWHYTIASREPQTGIVVAICLAAAAVLIATIANVSTWLLM